MVIKTSQVDLSQIDWTNPESVWHAHPSNHRLLPGGSEHNRYLWVRDQIPRNSRVLDLGCNCGQLAVNLAQDLGCEVWGIDIVPEFVQHCNRKKFEYIQAWCVDFSRMNANEKRALVALGPFDVVTALEVIEHPIDIRGFRETVRLALREGGCLVITTPHPESPLFGYKFLNNTANHVRMWTPLRLEMAFGPMAVCEDIHTHGVLAHIGAVWDLR